MKTKDFWAFRRGWIETMAIALRAANDDKNALRRRIAELEAKVPAPQPSPAQEERRE